MSVEINDRFISNVFTYPSGSTEVLWVFDVDRNNIQLDFYEYFVKQMYKIDHRAKYHYGSVRETFSTITKVLVSSYMI